MIPIIEIVVNREGLEACTHETAVFVQRFVDTVGEAFAKLDGVTDDISVVEGPTEDKTQYVVTVSHGEANRENDADFASLATVPEVTFEEGDLLD
jgi:hypothetical protein